MKFSRKNFFGFCMMVSTLILCLSLSVFVYGAGVEKVIVDSDMAGDDMDALLLLLQADNVEVLGVTLSPPYEIREAVGALETRTARILRIVEVTGKTDVGVYPGFAEVLISGPAKGILDPVPGEPTEPYTGFAKIKTRDQHAVDFIIETVNANPGEVNIQVWGPWTNIAVAIRKDPTIAGKIKRIYTMGGMFGIGKPGYIWNYGEGGVIKGEGNFWADAEACYIGMHSGIPLTIAPAEFCMWVKLTKEMVDTIVETDTPVAETFKERQESYESRGRTSSTPWDSMAALAMMAPELMKYAEHEIDIVLSGPAYGVTYAVLPYRMYRYSPPNLSTRIGEEPVTARILYDVDLEAFEDLFVKLMTK